MDLLSTDRTVMKEIQSMDYEEVKELYLNPLVRKYLGGPREEDGLDALLDGMQTSGVNSLYLVVREKGSNHFIGFVSLDPHHDGDSIEISYQFLPHWWGKGYGSEIVREVVDYAFSELKLQKITAETQMANVYSCRLLERTGMELDKTLIRFGETQCLYSLSRSERR
ncbi:GNAT family N-acetyltransferase [Halobacillus litoralis]|uniref:GNAT family N-acetyltransferase n=1 Tax=Halobacillus litoralis TaxID=45668 RepID=UPI001CFDB382|nr:GNAT family N-acetyltransferase [Halobacillus litoralis]WLR46399.1 GNAT family N-acetyltransferase [Halobacillus litoralis]